MTIECEALLPSIAAQAAGLALADDESARCAEHLARCPSCPALATDVERALAEADLEPRFAPESTWDRIAEGIRAERARALAAPSLRVLLACTFCHGPLERRDSAFCATCLAPHHAECFETHGRCGAAGCDETHVVAPRPVAHRPKRRWRLPLAIALTTVGAAALGGRELLARRTPAPTVRFLLGDAPAPAPAYPALWEAPAPGSPRDRLEKTRVTFNFEDTPFGEAIDFLRDLTGLTVVVTPSAQWLVDNEHLKITGRARDVTAWQLALFIVGRHDRLGVACTEHTVRILTDPDGGAVGDPRRLLEDEAWKAEVRERLARPVHINFLATPFDEAVDFLRELTGLRFGVSRSIDQKQVKVTIAWREGSAASFLDELVWLSGFDWDLRQGMVWIAPKDQVHAFERAGVGALDVRGVTVPALVAALHDEAGIDVVATREAWGSRGSVSLVLGEPYTGAGLIAAIASQTALRPTLIEGAGVGPVPRTVLVLDGVVPSVEDARAASHGAEARELERAVEARSEARADSNVDPRVLAERESAVARTAARILSRK